MLVARRLLAGIFFLALGTVLLGLGITPGARASALTRPFIEVQPMSEVSAAGLHWRYDLVFQPAMSAQLVRWTIVQGPEISLVFEPDAMDPVNPVAFAGPTMSGPRMLEPQLGLLFPYFQSDAPIQPGVSFASWQGDGVLHDVHVSLTPTSETKELADFTAMRYELDVEVRKSLVVGEQFVSAHDLFIGDVWVVSEMAFTDAVLVPYHGPFLTGIDEVDALVRRRLLEQLRSLGMVTGADVTLFSDLPPDELTAVRAGGVATSTWPMRTTFWAENLHRVDAPSYETLLPGTSLIDWAGYERLLSPLLLFDVWEPCFPYSDEELVEGFFNVFGTMSGPLGAGDVGGEAPIAVRGFAMHGGDDVEGTFGLHFALHPEGGDTTMCVAVLRIADGTPEPGAYGIVGTDAAEGDERVGRFIGHLVGVSAEDPYAPWTFVDEYVFDAVSGTLHIEVTDMTVPGIDGTWIGGRLQLDAAGVLLRQLDETLTLSLTLEFESWGGLSGAPRAR